MKRVGKSPVKKNKKINKMSIKELRASVRRGEKTCSGSKWAIAVQKRFKAI